MAPTTNGRSSCSIGRWPCSGAPALAEFANEPWASAEAHRLDGLRIEIEEVRAELLLDTGSADRSLLPRLQKLVDDHPSRTMPVQLLMLASYRAGRQSEALAVYARHRDELAERGLEPADALRSLEEQILTDHPEVAAAAGRQRVHRGYELGARIDHDDQRIRFRGLRPDTGREVTIEQVRATVANTPTFVRRFAHEALLVARLQHLHVVPLLDHWRDPDGAFLVTPPLGETLADRLARGCLSVQSTVRLVSQIGGALAAAHRHGLVHGDVTAERIRLDTDGHAALDGFAPGLTTGVIDPLQPGDAATDLDIAGLAAVARSALAPGSNGAIGQGPPSGRHRHLAADR